jgi:hypothetical protein
LFKTALLETQAQTTIDGILVVDEADHVVLANKRFAHDFGIPNELLGTGDDRILKNVMDKIEDTESFVARVQYLYSHRGEKSRDELRFKDGRTFHRYSAPLSVMAGKSSRAVPGLLLRNGFQFHQGSFNPLARHVPVRHHAHGMDGRVLRPHASGVQSVAEFDGIHAAGAAIEDDDVALDAGGIDSQAVDLRDTLRKALRVTMIFMQACRRFLQRYQTRGRNHANLPHAAAKHFPVDARSLDEFL